MSTITDIKPALDFKAATERLKGIAYKTPLQYNAHLSPVSWLFPGRDHGRICDQRRCDDLPGYRFFKKGKKNAANSGTQPEP